MNHLIIGTGRLARALFAELRFIDEGSVQIVDVRKEVGDVTANPSKLYTRVRKWADSFLEQGRLRSELVVWNCLAAGSVAECKEDPQKTALLHTLIPVTMSGELYLAGVRVVNFSSDYAAYPELSQYAFQKWALEKSCHEHSIIIRVSSLYSTKYKPDDHLFARLKKNFPQPCKAGLPRNVVFPSPVEWVAKEASEFITRNKRTRNGLYTIMPIGQPVAEVASRVMGTEYKFEVATVDRERPASHPTPVRLINDPSIHWFDLMKHYAPELING